jgi:glutamate dehydrogenase
LRGYFPRLFADRFPAAVASHPLRGEIIAVELANELIDAMGIAFLVRAVRDSGCDVLDVVRAWVASAAILDAAALRAELDAARERLSAESERRVAVDLAGALERATLWLLQTQPTPLSTAALTERFRSPVTALLAAWPETLLPAQRAGYAAGQSALRNAGVSATLADRLARAADIDRALEIVHIGHAAHVPAALAAAAYLHAEELVDLSWIRGVLRDLLPAEDRWEPRAAAALAEELLDLRRRLALQVLAQRNGDAPIDACVGAFTAGHREQLDAVTALIDDLKAAPQPTLPALLVILHEIGRLARAPEVDRTW